METEFPHLDDRCSDLHCYRDFVECSATWKKTKVTNIPQATETFEWIGRLGAEVLDPLAANFDGPVRLTYGFCSTALARQIHKGIAPKLDQHAGFETNVKGNRICGRDGFAADFLVQDVSSLMVAQWVVTNISFDRLYYYGPDRPLHVSVSPNPVAQIVSMSRISVRGHPVPSVVKLDTFLTMTDERS